MPKTSSTRRDGPIRRIKASSLKPISAADAAMLHALPAAPKDTAEPRPVSKRRFKTALAARTARHEAGVMISLRMDPDVLAWYRAQGEGYQVRMKDVLKAHYLHHQGDDPAAALAEAEVLIAHARSRLGQD